MSAFGRRGGMGASRPSFGVAKPMKGGTGAKTSDGDAEVPGGDQFPPLESLSPDSEGETAPTGAAMDRLTARQNQSGEAGVSKAEGFEASVHKIKEQVLPRLLERVDPEA